MTEPLRVLDLFSGIGGFSLGLERTGGFKTVAFCEIEEYPRRVLAKHWPGVPCYHDVRELTAERLSADGIVPDVLCGGFPCQDISIAGARIGIEGARSGLWSEYSRLIREVRPQYVIVENVAALLSNGLGRVLGDLAEIGFDAEWHCIPASAIGAPHRRDRLWIMGHADSFGRHCRSDYEQSPFSESRLGVSRPSAASDVANADDKRELQSQGRVGDIRRWVGCGGAPISYTNRKPEGRFAITWPEQSQWLTEPDVGRVADGVPARVDRLRGLGNAVVPQIPEIIGRAILATERRVSDRTASNTDAAQENSIRAGR